MSTFRDPDGSWYGALPPREIDDRLSLGASALVICLLSGICWGLVVSVAVALSRMF